LVLVKFGEFARADQALTFDALKESTKALFPPSGMPRCKRYLLGS
jgi:hypothetical protein